SPWRAARAVVVIPPTRRRPDRGSALPLTRTGGLPWSLRKSDPSSASSSSSSSSSSAEFSPRKRAANRRNARKSTGPRTDEGKARAARNAVTHGLFCRAEGIVLAGESHADFDALRRDLIAALRPQDAMEMALVEQIVIAHWLVRRARAA